MKIIYLILAAFLIIFLVIIGIGYLTPKTPYAEIKGHSFSLYLAKTSKEQEIGLSKFNKIDKNKGMLFIFQKPDYYSFWMRDMKFPIDIIFINKDKIVDIFQKVPVPKEGNVPIYTTKEKADKVLEISSGLSSQYGIKKGDKVKIKL